MELVAVYRMPYYLVLRYRVWFDGQPFEKVFSLSVN
jgi:hypothetical protein